MPLDNLGNVHFTNEQIAAIDDALKVIWENLEGVTRVLSPKERSRYGKVGDQKELFIEKVKDYRNADPEMSSPEVDWDEFFMDYRDRKQANQMLWKVGAIETMLKDIKYLRDYDNYNDALRDYSYSQYKNRFGKGISYEYKIDQMKIFFPRTGKTGKKKDDTNDNK